MMREWGDMYIVCSCVIVLLCGRDKWINLEYLRELSAVEAHSRSGVQVQLPEVTESLEDTESTSVT